MKKQQQQQNKAAKKTKYVLEAQKNYTGAD